MTVRLLKPYAGRPANAITSTLDASTEAALIAAGKATADLTGGIKYFVTRPGLAVQPKQIAVGAISLKMEEQATATLPEGQVLMVTGGVGVVGEVTRLNGDKWTVLPGSQRPIGPFSGSHKLTITCTSGGLSASVQDASVVPPSGLLGNGRLGSRGFELWGDRLVQIPIAAITTFHAAKAVPVDFDSVSLILANNSSVRSGYVQQASVSTWTDASGR